MKRGTRAELQAAKRRTVDVEFPELDAVYTLREMSGSERDSFEESTFEQKEEGTNPDGTPHYIRKVITGGLRARLVARCLVGEDGSRLFADDEIHQLNDAVPASILNKLWDAAQKLNGLEPKAVEEAEKNSGAAPSSGSATG